MIRVQLPTPLMVLAGVAAEVSIDVEAPVTVTAVLDALEYRYPVLRGAIRDHVTYERRPYLRFFACELDLSHDPTDRPLPASVTTGEEPLIIIGAIAGGSPEAG